MKILSILLSLLLAIPMVQPCAGDLFCRGAEEVCVDSRAAEPEEEKSCHQAGKESHHQEEECPPGCSCLCCVPLITTYSEVFTPEAQVWPARRVLYEPTGYSHDFSGLIWQPPRLG